MEECISFLSDTCKVQVYLQTPGYKTCKHRNTVMMAKGTVHDESQIRSEMTYKRVSPPINFSFVINL